MARKKTSGPTDRELAILGVLWQKGPSTVREVHEALDKDAQTGYTTTLKLMQIMVEKGLLVREDDGRQRGMGFQPMNHRQDADVTKEQGQDALATRGQDARDTQGQDALATRGQDARDTQGRGVPNAKLCVGETRDALVTSRRRHIYRPALSEERTQNQVVQDLLDRVFAGSAEKLVMRALSARKVSPKELKRIRDMLDEMEGA